MTNSSVSGTENKSLPRSDAPGRPPNGPGDRTDSFTPERGRVDRLTYTDQRDWVVMTALNHSAYRMYSILRSMCIEQKDGGHTPTQALTMDRLCWLMSCALGKVITDRGVRKMRDELEEAQLLDVVPGRTNSDPPRYVIHDMPPEGWSGWLNAWDANRAYVPDWRAKWPKPSNLTGSENGLFGVHSSSPLNGDARESGHFGMHSSSGGTTVPPTLNYSSAPLNYSSPPRNYSSVDPWADQAFVAPKEAFKENSKESLSKEAGPGGEVPAGEAPPEAAAGGRERDLATPDNLDGAGAGGPARAGGGGGTVPDGRADASSSLNGPSVPSPEPVVQAYTEAARRASVRLSAASVEKVRRQIAKELSEAPWEPYRAFLAEIVVEMGERGWTNLGRHLEKNKPPRELKLRPWCGECGDPEVIHANCHPRTAMGLRRVGPGFLKPCPACSPYARSRAA